MGKNDDEHYDNLMQKSSFILKILCVIERVKNGSGRLFYIVNLFLNLKLDISPIWCVKYKDMFSILYF